MAVPGEPVSSTDSPIRQALTAERIVRVGHRGAAALAPENSLESIAAALAHNLDMVEFDVVRGDRNVLVVAHDPAAINPESPTLVATLEFLREVAADTTTITLDLKVGDAAAEVMAMLRRFDLIKRTIVSALHARWLLDIRREDSTVTTGLSYPNDRAGVADRSLFQPFVRSATAVLRRALPHRVVGMAARAGADAIMLHHSVVSAAVVQRCVARSLPVFAWTVDDVETARSMAAAGVHGIVSNDPRVFDAI